jgi:hypothetical protein
VRGGGVGAKKAEQSPELYDLDADFGENTNVAEAHPDIVKQLLALAEKTRDDIGDARLGRKGRNVREVGRVDQQRASGGR